MLTLGPDTAALQRDGLDPSGQRGGLQASLGPLLCSVRGRQPTPQLSCRKACGHGSAQRGSVAVPSAQKLGFSTLSGGRVVTLPFYRAVPTPRVEPGPGGGEGLVQGRVSRSGRI